jgi:hypothetical protein
MRRDAWDENFDRMIQQHARDRPDCPHQTALEACCRLVGKIDVAGVWVPIVAPLNPDQHQMDFDRIVCAAGFKRFVRRTLTSDQAAPGTAINPQTMERDPAIAIPEIDLGDWLIVLEMQEGLRLKTAIRVVLYEDAC